MSQIDEGEAGAVAGGALELVGEPGRQLAPVREARQRVGVRLPRQPRDVTDDLRERASHAARDQGGERQRQSGGEEDEAAVARRERVDRRRRARLRRATRRRPSAAPTRRRTSSPRSVRRPPSTSTGAPSGPPAMTRPLRTRSRPACSGSGVAWRSTARTSSPSGSAIVTVASRRTPSVIFAVEEIRGAGASSPIDASADVDPRAARLGDAAQLGLVAGDDGALKRERGRELGRLHAQVRLQRVERRGADPCAAGERRRVLLPAAAARVAVERDRGGNDERAREEEDEYGITRDGRRCELPCTRSTGQRAVLSSSSLPSGKG